MSDTIIKVENVGKRYVLAHQRNKGDGLRHRIEGMARSPLRWLRGALKAAGENNRENGAIHSTATSRGTREEFWALKDLNFEIKQGDVVGVIGRNGAGKSTLLKILSRITEPTTGRIVIDGRVASLLEVGTGFHPELTGRENIFLNGAILGMSNAEIKNKFDEIVAFAEIEKFLDTPVKRYSSGMYVRLAFAVAAHLEPEILIVDEVLAVGDAQFQKKCLGKMQSVSQQEGRTVLFVSHNMAAVMQLTRLGMLLQDGRLKYIGPTENAIEVYHNSYQGQGGTVFDLERAPRKFIGSQAARFVSARFDRPFAIFESGEDFKFVAKIRARERISRLGFSMTLFTSEGTPVGNSFGPECLSLQPGELVEMEVVLPGPRLAPGHYYCAIAVGKGDNMTGHIPYDVVHDTLPFEARPAEGEGGTVAYWYKGWGSIVFMPLQSSRYAQVGDALAVNS